MYKIALTLCVCSLVAFSGCNQGEIELLKEQVAELKQENAKLKDANADLSKKLEDAKIELAKREAINTELSEKMGALKKLMPDVGDLGEAIEAAKELGLPELKDFDKKKFLDKAKEELKEKTTL